MEAIEFIGVPRSGKTTQIERAKKYLEKKGHRVAVLTDRERAKSISTSPSCRSPEVALS